MNLKNKLYACLLAASLTASTAQAIDIDLYTINGSSSATPPNILFILDNASEWGSNYTGGTTKAIIEHEALYKFLDELGIRLTDGDDSTNVAAKIGIMVGGDSNSIYGGKVVKHFTLVDIDNITNISKLKKVIYNCNAIGTQDCLDAFAAAETAGHAQTGPTWQQLEDELADKSLSLRDKAPKNLTAINTTTGGSKYATVFHEAHQYFSGQTPYGGTLNFNLPYYDPEAVSNNKYVSPIVANEDDPTADVCGKNYIVLLANGSPANGEDGPAQTLLEGVGGNTTVIPLNPKQEQSNYSDEYSRFLASADIHTLPGKQNILSYVISVSDPAKAKQNEAAHALLKSVAAQGKGAYFDAENVTEIVDSLLKILSEIEAVNDVFAATALPVSVNVRGTNLNQNYIGVFRPDSAQKPRWYGNMKLYQFAKDQSTGLVSLRDADLKEASSAATGFIKEDARSFWTHGSSYWSFNPDGLGGASDSPDGELVEKGAAAQQQREAGHSGRNLYTCINCNGITDLTLTGQQFSNSNNAITEAALDAVDAAERTSIINWTRGQDVLDENSDGSTTDTRPTIHGDVLHSRPAVISFGPTSSATPDKEFVYIFYGSNDGVFRAVQGGTDETSGSTDGDELWGFIPEEHLGQLKTLYKNEPLETNYDKPFFVDGSIGSYIETTTADDDGDGTPDRTYVNKAYLYLTMRRGGNFIYALDVSTPTAPKILWRKNQADTGFSELGQTWSEPKILKIKGHTNPVLFFGLGYDPTADDSNPAGDATKGRGIIMVDAFTGDPLWQAGSDSSISTGASYAYHEDLKYSVPAALTVIDRDRNDEADRIYFGDTGGQLWRVDIFDEDRGNWNINKLLTVGGSQKFLSAPNVVASEDPLDLYDAVQIGTGDRETPFDTSIPNYFILYKDRTQGVANSTVNSITLANLANATVSTNLIADTNKVNGWYISLSPGEKVTSKPATVAGITFFNTFQPGSASACGSNLGIARTYRIKLDSTAALDTNNDGSITDSDRAELVTGGGFLPDPTTSVVDVPVLDNEGNIVGTDSSREEVVCSGPKCERVDAAPFNHRFRTFWLKKIDE